jgi:hypothetical protein
LVAVLASHPEQLAKVDAVGRGRFRIESIIRIHPGADAGLGRSTGKEGQGKARASRRCGASDLADGANRQAAIEQPVRLLNACRGDLAESAGRQRQRGGKAAGQGVFDLEAKGCGGRHDEGDLFSSFIRLDSPEALPVVKGISVDFLVNN